jgi:hypothetical protein
VRDLCHPIAFRSSARGACLVAALALAGCETLGSIVTPTVPPPCPAFAKVEDAAKLTRFTGAGRDLTDVLFEAELTDIAAACSYSGDTIDVASRIRFVISRGPADTARRADFRYFVAVSTRDKKIVGREVFDSSVEFPGNHTRASVIEELEQEIPIREGEEGVRYVIFFGFELTEDELAFNRKLAK